MKVVTINGSHRPKKSTSRLLQIALDDFARRGWETQLIELGRTNIEFCIGCNSCLKGKPCPLLSREGDEMQGILDAIEASDAIIVGSPNYFCNVTARMKNFMDRTRPPHLAGDIYAGKVAGVICTTGLNNAGADSTGATLQRFCSVHGWLMPKPSLVTATWDIGPDEDGRVRYRTSAADDPQALEKIHRMTKSMMELAEKTH